MDCIVPPKLGDILQFKKNWFLFVLLVFFSGVLPAMAWERHRDVFEIIITSDSPFCLNDYEKTIFDENLLEHYMSKPACAKQYWRDRIKDIWLFSDFPSCTDIVDAETLMEICSEGREAAIDELRRNRRSDKDFQSVEHLKFHCSSLIAFYKTQYPIFWDLGDVFRERCFKSFMGDYDDLILGNGQKGFRLL